MNTQDMEIIGKKIKKRLDLYSISFVPLGVTKKEILWLS